VLNIEINPSKLSTNLQNFTLIYLAWMKILQKASGATFLNHTVGVNNLPKAAVVPGWELNDACLDDKSDAQLIAPLRQLLRVVVIIIAYD